MHSSIVPRSLFLSVACLPPFKASTDVAVLSSASRCLNGQRLLRSTQRPALAPTNAQLEQSSDEDQIHSTGGEQCTTAMADAAERMRPHSRSSCKLHVADAISSASVCCVSGPPQPAHATLAHGTLAATTINLRRSVVMTDEGSDCQDVYSVNCLEGIVKSPWGFAMLKGELFKEAYDYNVLLLRGSTTYDAIGRPQLAPSNGHWVQIFLGYFSMSKQSINNAGNKRKLDIVTVLI
uniref:Uncharacterized protein n=2 Tax=Oryza glumipatula TaxID=40148 RepID=A0A0D9ZXJ5_9ORYZ